VDLCGYARGTHLDGLEGNNEWTPRDSPVLECAVVLFRYIRRGELGHGRLGTVLLQTTCFGYWRLHTFGVPSCDAFRAMCWKGVCTFPRCDPCPPASLPTTRIVRPRATQIANGRFPFFGACTLVNVGSFPNDTETPKGLGRPTVGADGWMPSS
jgi:hypothetical protein